LPLQRAADQNAPSGLCVFDGIGQQIAGDATEQHRIAQRHEYSLSAAQIRRHEERAPHLIDPGRTSQNKNVVVLGL